MCEEWEELDYYEPTEVEELLEETEEQAKGAFKAKHQSKVGISRKDDYEDHHGKERKINMKKYNVLLETESEQLFLFPVKAESHKQANALVMRESMNQPFLDGVELSTIGVFEEGTAVNLLEVARRNKSRRN